MGKRKGAAGKEDGKALKGKEKAPRPHPLLYVVLWASASARRPLFGLPGQTSPLSARRIVGVTLAEKFGAQRTRDRYLKDFTLFTGPISRHPESAYVSQGL